MGSRFYFGGSDDSGSEFDGNDSSLPFPKPLARSAFLEPGFDPTIFLATLSDRYQTLEDLRNELRELSQSLNRELLDLVNDNYQDFLSLGSTLRGGEERIEEVRVGLLGFQRELTSVRKSVGERRENVAALIDEKRRTMKHIQVGTSLLEIAEHIEDLEASMRIGATNGRLEEMNGQNEDSSEESDNDAEHGGISMRHVESHVEQYLILRLLVRRHPTQPYILSQSNRISGIKSTLLLDLEGALKHCRSIKKEQLEVASRINCLRGLLLLVRQEEQPTNAAP